MQDGKSQFASYPSLKGRAVLITGGATGIGESLVTHFARQGSRVAFFDMQDEAARQLVESLAAEGCPAPRYLHCDLTDLAALRTCADEVVAAWGRYRRAGEQRGQRSAAHHRRGDAGVLGQVDCRESAPAVLHDPGRSALNAQGRTRLNHQYEFDLVDDSLHRRGRFTLRQRQPSWGSRARWRTSWLRTTFA